MTEELVRAQYGDKTDALIAEIIHAWSTPLYDNQGRPCATIKLSSWEFFTIYRHSPTQVGIQGRQVKPGFNYSVYPQYVLYGPINLERLAWMALGATITWKGGTCVAIPHDVADLEMGWRLSPMTIPDSLAEVRMRTMVPELDQILRLRGLE